MKKTITILGLFLLFAGFNYADAAATLSFSPSQKTVEQGQDFTIAILANTGSVSANAAGINVSFPKDKLEARSVGTSGSVLTIFAEKEIGDGLIVISGGIPTPGFAGTKNIVSITFRAKASSGSAQIKFAEGSVILKDSDNTNFLDLSASGAATITFKGASAVAPPSAPVPAKDTKAPAISNIEVRDVTTSTVSISWKTDENGDSRVEYGFTPGEYNFTWSDRSLVKNHTAKIENLPSGETFYYLVSSRDSAGNEAVSTEQVFMLAGYKIQIKYSQDGGKPLAGAQVTLFYGADKIKTGATDDEGSVIFENVMPGQSVVIVKYKDFTSVDKINVIPDKDFQTFRLGFLTESSYIQSDLFMWMAISAIAFLVFLFILLKFTSKI